MNITITINTDNAAFEGDDCAPELARILRDAADKIEAMSWNGDQCSPIVLRDINGNKVGKVEGAE